MTFHRQACTDIIAYNMFALRHERQADLPFESAGRGLVRKKSDWPVLNRGYLPESLTSIQSHRTKRVRIRQTFQYRNGDNVSQLFYPLIPCPTMRNQFVYFLFQKTFHLSKSQPQLMKLLKFPLECIIPERVVYINS